MRVLALLMLLAAPAWASKHEAEDLKRQIDTQRSGLGDLERLDVSHVATAELTLLRSWLDEATNQLTVEKFERVREVIDRCLAQAELIRQKTSAGRLTQQANERESALKRSRDKVARTRDTIQQAAVNKKALELNAK
jgi:hypothetical protein